MGAITTIHKGMNHPGYSVVQWAPTLQAHALFSLNVASDFVDAWYSDRKTPETAVITIGYVDAFAEVKGVWSVSKGELRAILDGGANLDEVIEEVSFMWATQEEEDDATH